ncbi:MULTISPECIES: hypothetical protein [unclassified Pseudomonas]|uniref:hypothetical protein n=1 Tax=unclassified Pseudomonas TaxID=196821 RepID=UPI0008383024|nr:MULTISPECIES: hypothetical protein [unclassified Pseudomonas]QIH05206.1 hypothetical protein ATY02_00335 [Pseudomonas sp. BIOMIG1BAC]
MKENIKELRSHFEKALQGFLKSELAGYPGVKVTKNKIAVSHKESGAVANLHFEYLANSRAYETIILVEHPTLQAELDSIGPPYPSNLPNAKFVYSMSTVSEDDACPLLPVTEQGIESTCQRLLRRLQETDLPIVSNLLNLGPGLVNDVIARPKYFSYPVPLIFIALRSNGMKPDADTLARILSEQTLGYTNHREQKDSFNKQLLAALG